MTRDEYLSELQEALALRGSNPKAAVASLRRLAKRLDAAVDVVGPAEAAEPLGFAATILAQQGSHVAAANAFRAVAEMHLAPMRHHGFGRGSALASASLELFRANRPRAAAELAWEALALLGRFPDPSSIHQEVIRRLREHLNEQASP